MNAKEIAKKSEQKAKEIQKEQEDKQQKYLQEQKTKTENEAKKYEESIFEDAEWSIKNAAESGRKKTSITLSTTDIPYESDPDWFTKNNLYAPLVQKLMNKLKKDGFTVELSSYTNKYRTQHESSVPDYNYYDYSTILKISW